MCRGILPTDNAVPLMLIAFFQNRISGLCSKNGVSQMFILHAEEDRSIYNHDNQCLPLLLLRQLVNNNFRKEKRRRQFKIRFAPGREWLYACMCMAIVENGTDKKRDTSLETYVN